VIKQPPEQHNRTHTGAHAPSPSGAPPVVG